MQPTEPHIILNNETLGNLKDLVKDVANVLTVDNYKSYPELLEEYINYPKDPLIDLKTHTVLLCKFYPLLLCDMALNQKKKGLHKIYYTVFGLSYDKPEYRPFCSWLRYFVYHYSYSYTGKTHAVVDFKEDGLQPYLRKFTTFDEYQKYCWEHQLRADPRFKPEVDIDYDELYRQYIEEATLKDIILEGKEPTAPIENPLEKNSLEILAQPTLTESLLEAKVKKPNQTKRKPNKPKPDSEPTLFSF